MGALCCKAPDDDDAVPEAKPVNEDFRNSTGSYGAVKESVAIRDETFSKATEENSKGGGSSNKETSPDAATEATPLLDSDTNPAVAVPVADNEHHEDSGDDLKPNIPPSDSEKEEATGLETVTSSSKLEGQETPPPPYTGTSAHQTSDTPVPQVKSVSEEAIDEEVFAADGAREQKKKKSVGKAIKKKFGKLGKKRKGSKDSNTTDTRSRSVSSKSDITEKEK